MDDENPAGDDPAGDRPDVDEIATSGDVEEVQSELAAVEEIIVAQWQVTEVAWTEMNDRIAVLEALEAGRNVPATTETTSEATGEETPLPEETPAPTVAEPAAEETPVVHNRRLFRRV